MSKHWHLDYRDVPVAHDHRSIPGHEHPSDPWTPGGYTGQWRSKDGAIMEAARRKREEGAPHE